MKTRRVLLTISILFFLCSSVFGIIMMHNTPDSRIIQISTWDELSQANIQIRNQYSEFLLHDEETEQSQSQIMSDLESADVIVLVKAKSELLFTTAGIGQKVTVEDVYKGDAAKGEIIEIYSANHLSLENGQVLFYGWYNYMIPENRYLVFLQKNELNRYQRGKTFQVANVSYLFPAYFPITEDLEQDEPFSSSDYKKNINRILFTDNEALINYYLAIREKALSLYINKDAL